MALCHSECWLRCAEALMAVVREALLDLLLDLVLDDSQFAHKA